MSQMSPLGSPVTDSSSILSNTKSYNSRYRRLRGGFHHAITPSSINSRRRRRRGGNNPLQPASLNSRRRRRRGGGSRKYRR